jgi:hypothetical protein
MAIVLQFAGHLADWLRSKGLFTTTQVCLIWLGLAKTQKAFCVIQK